MGRIRTDEVKNITNLVVGKYGLETFSDDFRKNKDLLKSLPEEFPSMQILNKVAGCIVMMTKKARAEARKLAKRSLFIRLS